MSNQYKSYLGNQFCLLTATRIRILDVQKVTEQSGLEDQTHNILWTYKDSCYAINRQQAFTEQHLCPWYLL